MRNEAINSVELFLSSQRGKGEEKGGGAHRENEKEKREKREERKYSGRGSELKRSKFDIVFFIQEKMTSHEIYKD